jgi:hypothetical protein
MAFFPFVFLDDNLSDAGDLVSVEMFRQLAQNLNYLVDSVPVGKVVPILVGLPGVPLPDPLMFHPCDGSLITNENSRMHNTNAPNMADAEGRYLKGFTTLGTVGSTGGDNYKNLSHAHGGSTAVFDPGGDNSDTDEDFITVDDHSHPISSDLGSHINFEPVHIRIKHYVKIL